MPAAGEERAIKAVFGHYILIGHEVLQVDDVLDFARWFETAERRVRVSQVGPYCVSTVFLGLDHRFGGNGPPVLFETMVYIAMPDEIRLPFNNVIHLDHSFLDHQLRCCTWGEAEVQHREMIDVVKEPGDTVVDIWPETKGVEVNEETSQGR